MLAAVTIAAFSQLVLSYASMPNSFLQSDRHYSLFLAEGNTLHCAVHASIARVSTNS